MGHVRSNFSIGLFGITLLAAGSASPASSTDKVIAGEAAAQGANLVAGPRGVRYELRGGARLDFSEGAEFGFDPSLHLKLRKPNDPETITRAIHLVHGKVEVSVPTLRDPTAVMVRGPGKLSAVAKEGRLTFIADADRSTAAARVGEMLTGVGNDWRALKAGYARTFAPEDPAATVRPILGSPRVHADSKLMVVRGSEEAHVASTWLPVGGAGRYDVTVTRTGTDAGVVSHQIVTEPGTTLSSLHPGSYQLVVAAVDKQGLVGAASEPYVLRVLGVEAPAGSKMSPDGAVILGRDQRVSLVGAENLEVSFGSSPLFMTAPSQIGLAHNSATTVRFRAPGTSDETILNLEPEGLRAAVHIGPRAAKWPVDHVAIQIDLYDTNGRPVAENTPVEATVTVNLAKVQVAWERSGRTLKAALSPGVPPGPWVVRTEVRDNRGELIGRDFLEVAPLETRSVAVAQR
jgi:hypothetical protein